MIKLCLFICMLLPATILFAQQKNNELFIIQGQITACPEKKLSIYFETPDGESTTDSIVLDESGKFYLKTLAVKQPAIASIQKNNIQINDLLVAPGYNLTITGNGSDFMSLLKSKKMTGAGSESNRYHFLLDSILISRMDTTRYFMLEADDLLKYIKKDYALKDSVLHVVFNSKPLNDKYFYQFRKMIDIDNQFLKLYYLLSHVNMKNYDFKKSTEFVRSNFDVTILDNMFRDEYLTSSYYRNWIIKREYLDYILKADYEGDSTLRKQQEFPLRKVGETYKGKVKDIVLYQLISDIVSSKTTLNGIKTAEEKLKPYISKLQNPVSKKRISEQITDKKNEIYNTQTGMPAPGFVLQSDSGKTVSLGDFKGKVVYLDLWASWCGPCRQEIPALKHVYAQYKENGQIAFVSIAVNDGENPWRKALAADKPDWLQLIDKDGVVWKSYVAYSIPRYIIIDKTGKIANFDAPTPSQDEALKTALNLEIAK